jgi:hypothetical protein
MRQVEALPRSIEIVQVEVFHPDTHVREVRSGNGIAFTLDRVPASYTVRFTHPGNNLAVVE